MNFNDVWLQEGYSNDVVRPIVTKHGFHITGSDASGFFVMD